MLFGEYDVIAWAAAHEFTGTRGWMDGLGPFFAVELSIDGEVAVLLEYDERPGHLDFEVRIDLSDRERLATEWLHSLSISGSFIGTATGATYIV